MENGILKTVLTSREPVRGVLQSTGNLRERGVTPSNLFLVAQKSSSPEELKEELAVQKPSGEIPKPPVSKHPYFDK